MNSTTRALVYMLNQSFCFSWLMVSRVSSSLNEPHNLLQSRWWSAPVEPYHLARPGCDIQTRSLTSCRHLSNWKENTTTQGRSVFCLQMTCYTQDCIQSLAPSFFPPVHSYLQNSINCNSCVTDGGKQTYMVIMVWVVWQIWCIVSLGLITNRGLVEQVTSHFTSSFIPVRATEHK